MSFTAKLGRLLVLYGAWGLFAISFLDSSFLSFPLVNDLLLIHLASRNPAHAPLYAAVGTAGSLAGAFAIYALGRGGGELIGRKISAERRQRAERWLGKNDFAALLMASLLPPPTPFKLFPFLAGGLRMNVARFTVALLVGRGLRFAADAFLGARYGVAAESFIRQNLVRVSLALVAAILAAWLIRSWMAGRKAASGQPSAGSTEQKPPPEG